ncbi:MAG: T9SS type A sorting domain-containing protein [candidate division Zixibacteria bacterium]|nr:T9SS type A sorting domain-containing protein [candidate division Zixibacteria bacterium]
MFSRSKWRVFYAIGLVVTVALLAPSSYAGNVDVAIQNFSFVPEDVTIGVGDEVRWENFDGVNHTSTSDDGVWDSGVIPPGERFEFQFNTAGEYPYHCSIHPMMTGNVTVLQCVCEVDMIPDNPPVQVPQGGSFSYTGILENECNQPMMYDVWVMIRLPDSSLFGPVQLFQNVPIGGNQIITVPNIVQNVPNFAPLGSYRYIAYCGDYPDDFHDTGSFQFTVVSGLNGKNDEWSLSSWFDDTEEIPSEANILGNYPNPFNAQTNITFDVPSTGKAKLEIYNLLGQKVSTLHEGNLDAGRHTVSWDAENVSSGVYFYRLSTDDVTITRKMNLVK